MIKHFLILILITSHFLFPQDLDSLSTINDSTKYNIKPDSSVVANDTSKVALNDSLSVPETIIPIQMQPLTETSYIISRKDFLFNDYRYTGDFLKLFPLTFTQDLGFVGYPNQSFIYGIGDGGVSYMIDGVLWNDRYSNSLDLNLVQSEDIDSIEIVPLTRGFLYGPFNNAVTVNFITRDFVSQPPYSRIKYYEGPDGEAMIDGKFNAQVMKRLNLSFEVTNRGKDSTYTNTEFSLWQANAKLKYFLSNDLNFAVDYRFNHLKRGLNGGVNIDSAAQISSDVNSILYDPLQAPVLLPFKKQDLVQNSVVLKTLAKPFEDSKLYLSIYYNYGLDKWSNSWDSFYFKIDYKIKSYGANINYSQKLDIFTIRFLGGYEKVDNEINWVYDNYINKYFYDRLSLGGIITASYLDNIIQPSIYYKHSHLGNENINIEAMGADVLFSLTEHQKLYVGYSSQQNTYDQDRIPSFEVGARFKGSQIFWDLKYFSTKYYYETSEEYGFRFKSQYRKGLGLILTFKYWLFLLETNTSYYFKVENQYNPDLSEHPYNFPEWQFVGGLYVNNKFFYDNLSLKVGFKFHYTGKIYLTTGSSSSEGFFQRSFDPSNKLDFNLIGEIKERAIVYFIWENLFNNQYYITPYYPMPERNIRFGIAWELFN